MRRIVTSQMSTAESATSTSDASPACAEQPALGRAPDLVASVSNPIGASSSVAGSSFITDRSTRPGAGGEARAA